MGFLFVKKHDLIFFKLKEFGSVTNKITNFCVSF